MELHSLALLLFLLAQSWAKVVEEALRVSCLPDMLEAETGDEELCQRRGCVWSQPAGDEKAPACFYPEDYGYKMLDSETTDKGLRVNLQRKESQPSMFGSDFEFVTVDFEYQTSQRLRVRIAPRNQTRWEVPINIPSQEQIPEIKSYTVNVQSSPVFSFQVARKSSGQILFDGGLGGLVLSDQFLQISGKLPSENIYGFAEHEQPSFKHSVDWVTWGMFARDHPPEGDTNLYGVHPRYTVIEEDGNTHGVLFLNSNAQDVTLTPAPGLVYRTIGGVIDIYFFLGPDPEAVVSQYTEAVGRYYIPPYWSLGFHLCRWGYNTLENMQAAWQRTIDAGIPFDVQWGDIDYMDRRLDFTIDPVGFAGLDEFVSKVHDAGMKFVPILDPAISSGEPSGSYPAFDEGQELDVWVKNSTGQPLVGQVWPDDPTYFPDWSKPETQDWWVSQIKTFYSKLEFDGLWIDMNEPANFVTGSVQGCANNSLNYPPYKPYTEGPDLLQKTICLDSEQGWGSHYDTHSMYGWSETEPTLRGAREATGRRSLVLSRSTFVASGRWTAHWLGDNWSEWDNLHFSIIGMMQFNQFGIPLVGADICGFIGNATEELCGRWQQLGAFYPFSRNHNVWDAYDQDPGVWGGPGGVVATAARSSLMTKYSLLPYLYTLFYHHSVSGGTVVRPLWHEFTLDTETHDIDTQFMWGPSLLIAPVIEPGVTERSVYLPPTSIWYDYYNMTRVGGASGQITAVSELYGDDPRVPLFARGGSILPSQAPGLTTTLSRLNDMKLNIFLDEEGLASGDLYLDDGESIEAQYSFVEFLVGSGSFDSFPKITDYSAPSLIQSIHIAGVTVDVTGVMVNNGIYEDFIYNHETHLLSIHNLAQNPLTPFSIHWS